MDSARETALKVLIKIHKQGAYSTLALKAALSEREEMQSTSMVRELVYGVIENQRFIDEIISLQSNIKLGKIQNNIMEILRLGVYQILFLDRVPERAAVHESVELAKKFGNKGAAGFVNGILRRISEKREFFMGDKFLTSDKEAAIRYSHPDFVFKMWSKQYGSTFTKDLMAANNEVPPFTIRVNTLKTTKQKLIELLNHRGFDLAECRFAIDCIQIKNPKNITGIEEYKRGLFTIQDEAGMLVTEVMNPTKDSNILDVCSAPGGKATHMAQWINDSGIVYARDIYPHKINLIKGLQNRLDTKSIHVELNDALILDEELINKIDYCLVDAPCSGLGIIRRKPDIKLTRDLQDIEELIKLQKNILSISAKYVKPGGIMVYSTCTLNINENLGNVRWFLDQNRDFRLTPIVLSTGKVLSDTQSEGYVELFPNVHGTDGFFIARMERIIE
ncbi:MAG: 16S rRNA (cytosine(967)-C(5))-methyltransferase RsmB [Gudongella sp.]|nr:16S rRNA (cytosine(967)-C(5))-methyltransferase RsmB [Gudongella sp.]